MKQLQQQNKQNVDLLSAYFQHRSEPNYAWSRACSMFLELPGLRGFWPMSSIDYTAANRAIDESGQGNHLTDNNTVEFGYDSLAPYVHFTSANNEYLSRADGGAGNWADILGTETYIENAYRGLTFICWVYFDNAAAATELVQSKWGLAGFRSYEMFRRAGGDIRFRVSVDGTANVAVTSTQTVGATTWTFLAGRFIPSTSLSIFVNADRTDNLVGIPASIFDSASLFTLGVQSTLANYIDGRISMAALCAAQLSDAIILSLFEQTKAMYNV